MKTRHGIYILDDDFALLKAEAERQSENSPTKISVANVLHQMIQDNLAKSIETTPKRESKTKQHVKKKPTQKARPRLSMAEAIA